uniref:Glycosyltransferase 2-like domain-containing protein n=1 Tax=viral metagenome TaxID=1070528 RepID=A0A6C0JZZ4_9ZZZZ
MSSPSESPVHVERSEIQLEEKIKYFVETYSPKLYILTPCFGGMCFVNYTDCLIKTLSLFRHFNFDIDVIFCRNDSLVSRARNNLIAKAMSDPKMTHMIFIDNDITWNPVDILKLVISEKPIIGGAYPLKAYQWNKLTNPGAIQGLVDKKNNSILKDMISDTEMVQFNAVNYNINYLSNNLHVEGNIAKIKHLATGFMMIQRNVIEKMFKAFPSTKYSDDINFLEPNENDFAYALFDCGVEGGHYLSEDWMFCQRWSKMGGNIYLDVTINLNHIGIEEYRGSYVATIL